MHFNFLLLYETEGKISCAGTLQSCAVYINQSQCWDNSNRIKFLPNQKQPAVNHHSALNSKTSLTIKIIIRTCLLAINPQNILGPLMGLKDILPSQSSHVLHIC